MHRRPAQRSIQHRRSPHQNNNIPTTPPTSSDRPRTVITKEIKINARARQAQAQGQGDPIPIYVRQPPMNARGGNMGSGPAGAGLAR
jgi:hypothetical protein